MKTINLNELDTMRHTVVGLDGVKHIVRPLTPRVVYLIDAAERTEGLAQIKAYCDVVAALIPTMHRDQLDDLSVPQLLAIVALASTEARAVEDAVEESDPNGVRPVPSASGVPAATSSAAC